MIAEQETVIDVVGLTRRFRAKTALDNVALTVPRGTVFGLVGANGAGKTTLIKHIIGLLRVQSGRVRVFGRDPVADPVGVLAKVGYLAEENDLPGWMTVAELFRYTQAFYPTWDEAYAQELQTTFDLDPSAALGKLSKGQRARAGLLIAVAHRPDLLVLDEPSAGLDPIARRDILGAVVKHAADEGRTVLFSSHLLDEVERISDHVAMMLKGRILFTGGLDDIKESHCCLTLHFNESQPTPPKLPGVIAWDGEGCEWTALCNGPIPELRAEAVRQGARIVAERVPTLNEIFIARAGSSCS